MKNKTEVGRFFKFVLFSISAGLVQTLVFTLLLELVKWPYWPSYLIALVCSVIYNFTVNRRFTFRSVNNIPKAMCLVLLFYCAFTPLSTWWGDALTKIGWNEYVVLLGTMVINMILEFLWWRYVVVKNSINTRKDKNKV